MSFQFKIQLQHIKNPIVFREIIVNSWITFHTFHEIIQVSFGWSMCHLYCFSPKGWGSKPYIALPSEDDFNPVVNSGTKKISSIFSKVGQTFVYIYDFGDNWEHKIELVKILDNPVDVPTCVSGLGKCPPEDCGSSPGYESMKKTFLEDKKGEEAASLREWLGYDEEEDWDSNQFDLESTSLSLSQFGGIGDIPLEEEEFDEGFGISEKFVDFLFQDFFNNEDSDESEEEDFEEQEHEEGVEIVHRRRPKHSRNQNNESDEFSQKDLMKAFLYDMIGNFDDEEEDSSEQDFDVD